MLKHESGGVAAKVWLGDMEENMVANANAKMAVITGFLCSLCLFVWLLWFACLMLLIVFFLWWDLFFT